MKMIQFPNGDLYEYTPILAGRHDAKVVELVVDADGNQETTEIPKEPVVNEPPESTMTPERAKRQRAAAPVVTVRREDAGNLAASAASAVQRTE